jgi:ABC-type transport system involved in multi-copper enzyme maturation permease subunit
MSTATEQPGSGPASTASSAPFGRLLRTEFHRFRSRRFIQVLITLALLGWLAAVVIGFLNFGEPTEADFAEARQRIEQEVALQEGFRQDCLDEPGVPDRDCPPEISASVFQVEDFLDKAPFDLAGNAQPGAAGFGGASAVVAFLIGATWIGAEWSARSLVALLFWVPQRLKVMASKIAVLTVAAAGFGVAMQLAWLAMAGLLDAVAGNGEPLPDDFWPDLLATQGRSVLLVVLASLIGFGLANLVRNTGAALGVGFVYFAIVETALRLLRPAWEPWLLSNNIAGLIIPGGVSVFLPGGTPGPEGLGQPTEYLIGNLQAGVYLGVVTAVAVGIGVVLFARRDMQ